MPFMVKMSGGWLIFPSSKFAERAAAWCDARGINSDASLDAWLTANITTLAQLRSVVSEVLQQLIDFKPPSG
jgi:hypothetical protein